MTMNTLKGDFPGKATEFASMLRLHLPEFQQRYGVASLGLFGSYVRGEERSDSDLDVLVGVRGDSRPS